MPRSKPAYLYDSVQSFEHKQIRTDRKLKLSFLTDWLLCDLEILRRLTCARTHIHAYTYTSNRSQYPFWRGSKRIHKTNLHAGNSRNQPGNKMATTTHEKILTDFFLTMHLSVLLIPNCLSVELARNDDCWLCESGTCSEWWMLIVSECLLRPEWLLLSVRVCSAGHKGLTSGDCWLTVLSTKCSASCAGLIGRKGGDCWLRVQLVVLAS